MRNWKRAAAASLACLVIVFFLTDAQAATLKLDNATASEIHAIYISDGKSTKWEENIIDGYMLPPGKTVDIEIPSYRTFDLRVEDETGDHEDYADFPGKTRYIKLKGNGQSEYR